VLPGHLGFQGRAEPGGLQVLRLVGWGVINCIGGLPDLHPHLVREHIGDLWGPLSDAGVVMLESVVGLNTSRVVLVEDRRRINVEAEVVIPGLQHLDVVGCR
jgi:hypothetical protein